MILLLLIGQFSGARGLTITKRIDNNRGFSLFTFKESHQEVATFCLINPEKKFTFSSTDSDSLYTQNIEGNFLNLTKRNDLSLPVVAFLADFSTPIKTKFSLNPSFLLHQIGVLLFAPSYLKKVSILSPDKNAKKFFIEVKISDDKKLYGVLATTELTTQQEARNLLKIITELKSYDFDPISLLDFPIKLISFDGQKFDTLYESHEKHESYTCAYLSGKQKTVQ